jgi:DnaJ-class molecular chaperone
MSEDIIIKYKQVPYEFKIPKNCIICPKCNGTGEERLYYGGPHDRGQFKYCSYCMGKGYLEKELHERIKGLGWNFK